MDGARKPKKHLDNDASDAAGAQPEADALPSADMPGDVAALFGWLGVTGMKYRDFSQQRRESRGPQEQETSHSHSRNATSADVPHSGQPGADPDLPIRSGNVTVSPEKPVPPADQPLAESMLPTRIPKSRSAWQLSVALHVGRGATDGSNMMKSKPTQRETRLAVEEYARSRPYVGRQPEQKGAGLLRKGEAEKAQSDELPPADSQQLCPSAPSLPSWIGKGTRVGKEPLTGRHAVETLRNSRDQVVERWYALRSLMGMPSSESKKAATSTQEKMAPIVAIFSLAGGVGKTSVAASVTRVLAAQGERVLLVDMTSHDVLPFFFGAQSTRTAARRVFAPPPGTSDQPVHVVHYATSPNTDQDGNDQIAERLKEDSKGFSRIVVDLCTADREGLKQLIRLGAVVLMPLLPDMNSLLNVRTLQRDLAPKLNMSPTSGGPWYLLTQFDTAQALHLDIRDLLEEQLGELLLPFVVRSSSAMAEALAQGMTVVDYAPQQGIAQDLQQIAAWLRTLAEPMRLGLEEARWSER